MYYVQVLDGKVVTRAIFGKEMPTDWPGRASWHRNDEAQIGWAYAGGTFSAPVELAPPPASTEYRLYKSTLIRRLTEAEAVTLTALLDASPVKSKMLWNASEWLGSDDPLFTNLKQAISGALGAKRAAEILARE